jgi:hypothetical protein
MAITGNSKNCIDGIRCPAIKGLPTDIVTMLHKTMVHMVQMRRSIEATEVRLQSSQQAVWDSHFLLARLRRYGH